MTRQLLVPALLAIAIAAATGRISHSNELEAADADSPNRLAPLVAEAHAAEAAEAAGSSGRSALGISHEIAVRTEANAVRFSLTLTNESGKRLELNFPDGYTHDVTVLDAAGREVWRWSRGRLFTQAMRNKMLGADESFEVSEQWEPEGLRGTFTAVVELRSTNFPVADRAGFSIP